MQNLCRDSLVPAISVPRMPQTISLAASPAANCTGSPRYSSSPCTDTHCQPVEISLLDLHYFLANERTKMTRFQISSGFPRSPSPGILSLPFLMM